jgi:hypothetical protein
MKPVATVGSRDRHDMVGHDIVGKEVETSCRHQRAHGAIFNKKRGWTKASEVFQVELDDLLLPQSTGSIA